MSVKYVGQVGMIQYSTNAGSTWKLLMSTTKKDFKNDTDSVDVTSDSSGTFKEQIPSFQGVTLSCEGFCTLSAESSGQGSYDELEALQLAQTQFLIRVSDNLTSPTNINQSGTVFVKSLQRTMDTGKAVTFKVDFAFVNGYVNNDPA